MALTFEGRCRSHVRRPPRIRPWRVYDRRPGDRCRPAV